jgi:thiamine transport system ATP-binding protein
MLEIDHLRVEYSAKPAIEDVSLTVPDGTVVCIVGPSGSGKSTLLRAVAGLEPPTSGTIRWDDRDLAGVPTHRRRFGLMFQDHALFPHRDVLGNVAFGLRMSRLSTQDADARTREALTSVGLEGFEHRKVRELSGGEQQRVALARSIAPKPRLLMLDEPLGSLDRALRERLVVDLHALFRSTSITALFVTHDQDEAFALADSVVILHRGLVEQEGDPQEVWRRPRTEFAAQFLGFSNMLDASRSDGVVRCALGPVPAPRDAPSGALRVAVRPDGLRVIDHGEVTGEVVGCTFRRDHFLTRIATRQGTFEVATPEPAAPGTQLSLELDPAAAVVLPAQPGSLTSGR